MNKPIDTLIVDKIIAAICWLKGHAWLTPIYGQRACNRCGKKQYKGAHTEYQWVDYTEDVKEFKPVKPMKEFNPID